MPSDERPISRRDLARLLQPILREELRGSLPPGELPTPEALSLRLAERLASRLEWAAFAGVLESIEPRLHPQVPISDLVERGLAAFARALQAGPPDLPPAAAPPRVPDRPPVHVVLDLVRGRPERAFTMPEISEETGLATPVAAGAVSELVQEGQLVRDGFFVRLPGPGDELPPPQDADDPRGGDRRGGDRRILDRRGADRRTS